MMLKAILVALSLSLLSLAACSGSSEEDWQAAEKSARAYLEALKSKDFKAAFALHSADSQLVKNSSEERYVGLQEASVMQDASLFHFDYTLLPQTHTSTRAGLYEFKAVLDWGATGKPDLTSAQTVAPEMRITVKQSSGAWKVFVARKWYDLAEEMKGE